jgi:cytochrome c553
MKRAKLSRIKFALLAGLVVVAGCGQKDDPTASATVPDPSVVAAPAKKIAANSPSDAYRQMQKYEQKKEYGKLFDSYSRKLQGNMNAQLASAVAKQLTNNKSEQKRYAKMRGKDLFLRLRA